MDAPTTLPAPRRPLVLALGLGLAAAALVFGIQRADFLIDDAFISLRYARTWAETGVPRFNLSESPPVEGFSNPSWVWLLMHAQRLGLNLETVARTIPPLFGLATLLIASRFLLRQGLRDTSVVLFAWLLALFPPFVTWCSGGLEGSLFGLLALTTLVLFAPARGTSVGWGRAVAAGVAGALLAVTRPEGLVFALLLGACGLSLQLGDREQRSAPRFWRNLVAFAVTLSVLFGAFLAWRWSVFEAWVPNTAHAKSGGWPLARGARHLGSYFVLFWTPVLALVAPLLAAPAQRRLAWAAWLPWTASLVMNLVIGGDWMPMFRLLAPLSVFYAIALASAFDHLPRIWVLGLGLAALSALPAFDRHLAPRSTREALEFRGFQRGYQTEWQRLLTSRENVATFLTIGHGLARIAQPGESITLGNIGAIGWASRMEILDRNGLVDPGIARSAQVREGASAGHDKRVPRAYFLDREPTFWEVIWVPGSVPDWRAPGGRKAARILAARLGEEDRDLITSSRPEYHVFEEDKGTLVVLRRTEPGRTQKLWGTLLGE